MTKIYSFKELKNLLPAVDLKQKKLRKWFSLATRLTINVYFDKNYIFYFEKDFGNGVVFKQKGMGSKKAFFDFTYVYLNNVLIYLPIIGVKLQNGKYILKKIENPIELAKLGSDSPIVEIFRSRTEAWNKMVKTAAFEKLKIGTANIYLCVDSSVGMNAGTVIDEGYLYSDFYSNPPQKKEGARYLLDLLCKNYFFGDIMYIGDLSELTVQAINNLYESETKHLKCESVGKYCSYGCTHSCLKEKQKQTKTFVRNMLLTLLAEYNKLKNNGNNRDVV